jgi:hypothetical protein
LSIHFFSPLERFGIEIGCLLIGLRPQLISLLPSVVNRFVGTLLGGRNDLPRLLSSVRTAGRLRVRTRVSNIDYSMSLLQRYYLQIVAIGMLALFARFDELVAQTL